MASRRRPPSEVTFDERRDDRDYVSRSGSRYDDRYYERDIEFRRSAPPVRERERERDREEIDIREVRTRARDPPAFLQDDYGHTSAGPMVLRAREREDFDFIERPRRRAPSVGSDRQVERESITIRRDTEDTDSRYAPRRERSRDREEVVIRRDERSRAAPAPAPPPPRQMQEDTQRDEIIIRRDDRSRSRPPERDDRETEKITITRTRDDDDRRPRYEPPPERDDRETEKITITRTRDEEDRRPRYEPPPPPKEYDREEIVIRRTRDEDREPRYEPPPPPKEYDREEIVIRRTRDEDREPRYEPPPPKESSREEIVIRRTQDDDARSSAAPVVRPKSRERERARYDDSESENEIVIRRDEVKGRGRDTTREEIIIRSSSRSLSRSPSPAPSARSSRSYRPRPAPEPQIVYAPQIHQEVVTHHRHIDHGYELAIATRPRPISRPPSPPSPPRLPSPPPPPPPPPAREQSEERIEIHRSGERNGRAYDEDIIIDRNEGARSAPPPAPAPERPGPPARREPRYRAERDVEEEAEYYNQRALERSYPGEAYHGATRDWGVVDIPPGTRNVRMDGAGGGAQEISWQRYNGMRRSRFYPEADDDEAYSNYEVGRPAPAPVPSPRPEPPPSSGGDIGRRYGRSRDPKAGLWTEITKDLVVKEAITEMGYEYEETEEFFYVIAYLKYDDVARLVGLSEDIRKDRRRRVKEIEWESQIEPEPPAPRRPLAIEPPRPPRAPRPGWERDDERYIEREIIYRGGRPPPPPPPGWRR